MTSITLPETVTSIGRSAFSWCNNLSSINIGGKVTVIGEGAFSACSRLSSVHINSLSDWCKIEFESVDSNPLYQSRGSLYIDNEIVTELVIPEDVTEIKDYAFSNFNITELQIGSSVVSIGKEAFLGASLTSCLIPENVASLGERAFAKCDSLTTITFGDGIKEIPNKVLDGCSSLAEVVFGKNVELIAHDAFSMSTEELPVKKIVCYGVTPPTCPEHIVSHGNGSRTDYSAFYIYKKIRYSGYIPPGQSAYGYYNNPKLSADTKLYVPAKCGRTYETAWKRCLEKVNVIEME